MIPFCFYCVPLQLRFCYLKLGHFPQLGKVRVFAYVDLWKLFQLTQQVFVWIMLNPRCGSSLIFPTYLIVAVDVFDKCFGDISSHSKASSSSLARMRMTRLL